MGMNENEAIENFRTIAEMWAANTNRDKMKMSVTETFINNLCTAMTALNEIQQYRSIGTPEECRAAVEKQRARKDNHSNGDFVCTVCGKPIVGKFCHHCGNRCFFGW